MKAKLLTLGLAIILAGCGESEPNVRMQAYNETNQVFHYPYVRAEITATEDNVVVEEVIFNRGNCETFDTNVMNGRPILPMELKFGQTFSINSRRDCTAAEIEVVTNEGSWVWKLN